METRTAKVRATLAPRMDPTRYTHSYVVNAVPQYREITGTITIRARADLIAEIGRRKLQGNRAILLTMGSAAGRRMVISLPQVRFPPSGMNAPLEGLADIPLAFRALDSAEGAADAMLIQFT